MGGVRAEEVGVLEGHRQPCGDRDEGGRENGCVLHPWLVQVEDPDEARDEGREEGGLWQGGDGEGEASAEDRESFPGGRPEEQHLSRESCKALAAQVSCSAASRGSSAEVAGS